MANTIQLMIGNVIDPTFVTIPAYTSGGNPNEPQTGFLEVYAGAITLSPDGTYFQAPGLSDDGGGGNYSFCRILVPKSVGNDEYELRSYGPDGNQPLFWQAAVCVSLAGEAPLGNHTAINSVERSQVILQRQSYFSNDHQVLVLEFQTYYQNTNLLRVTYSITVSGQEVGGHHVIPPIIAGARPNQSIP